MSSFGLRSIYQTHDNEAYNYKMYTEGPEHYKGYTFDKENFALQGLMCFMISLISV
jgi:hypothetical protein